MATPETPQASVGPDRGASTVRDVCFEYGITAHVVGERDELQQALRRAIGADRPELIEVPVAPDMADE